MEKTREARRSATASMAASNGVTKRRQRFSENSRAQMHHQVRDRALKKERDPESLNRSKRRRSGRFAPRNERDCVEEEVSSDESQGDDDFHLKNHRRKSFPSSRVLRHASPLKVDDEMIGVPVPRKARSACVKKSPDCRTSSGSGGGGFGASPGSYSFEVVSPSSSTVSVKQKKVNGSKSRIPKPPKSFGTVEDDLEIEIAEVLSGLKKQSHCSKREDDSEYSLKGVREYKREGDESGGLIVCKTRSEADHSENIDKAEETHHQSNETEVTKALSSVHKEEEAKQETMSILDSSVSKGVLEGPRLESNCSSKVEIDLMVPPKMSSSPERVSPTPLASDPIATEDNCMQGSSVKSEEQIIVKNEMTPEQVKQKTVDKREWLNFDFERPSQETGRDSGLRLQNLDWNQHQQPKSVSAQQSSLCPVPVAVGGWPNGISSQGYIPMIQSGKPVDGSNGSSISVKGAPLPASQPRPKRCATHFFIARNIQLHQHFVKTNHLPQPSNDSFYIKSGDPRPAAGNPSLQGSSPTLSLFSPTQDRVAASVSAPKDKASESGHVSSTNLKKFHPPTASSSIVPSQTFIFPTNHHLQPVMTPAKPPHPTKPPGVAIGSTSVNFSHPSSSSSEASTPYYTVLPNNAYSFLPSTIRGGTPSQAFYNGSFYSPHMFQPAQLMQQQNQSQRETKASSCSSSSYRQPQPQVNVNSLSSQANVQKHRQQSQKSETKAAGDNSDSRGSHTQKGFPYGQIMTAPAQPQNISMSFANFTGASPPANLNFSSSGYHIVSSSPFVHQKNLQASDSKTGGGSCSSNVEEPKKTLPAKMNGQTLVFDNPSRTLNFVSGTWPSPVVPTISGDPSMFTQRQQQQSGRSKTMTHSQADSVPASPTQWINLKQFQPHQQIRTHGLTQISFAAPPKSQTSQGQHGRSGGSSPSLTGSAQHGKAANSKVSNSKALPTSPIPSSAAHAQDQTENSAFGSTQKTSPVCGRTVPPIITSSPGHLSELKY